MLAPSWMERNTLTVHASLGWQIDCELVPSRERNLLSQIAAGISPDAESSRQTEHKAKNKGEEEAELKGMVALRGAG